MDAVFDEGEEMLVVLREDLGWDRVNCQLYSGWRLCKRKPGVITDGARLVGAACEGIPNMGLMILRGCWSWCLLGKRRLCY